VNHRIPIRELGSQLSSSRTSRALLRGEFLTHRAAARLCSNPCSSRPHPRRPPPTLRGCWPRSSSLDKNVRRPESYERALRAHARYRAPEASDRALTQLAQAEAETVSIFEVLPDLNAGERPAIVEATFAVSAEDREPVVEALPAFDRNLKSASITIRMSKAECAQLRTRAAEAGLTMSAYLRSCTFEAESLRALVKDTLAQLRTEPSENDQDATPVAGGRWFGWLRRLWPNGSGRQQIARA